MLYSAHDFSKHRLCIIIVKWEKESHLMRIFDADDHPFIDWMRKNPHGFVINTERRPGSLYVVYHRAGCYHISTYGVGRPEGGFTQRQYIKVCSDSLPELLDWRVQYRSRASDTGCQTCAPGPLDASIIYPDQVDDKVTYREGATTVIRVNAYERNPQARQRCLKRYGFACRVCEMSFNQQYGEIGDGFIHVHHLRPLSTIGEDYAVDPIEDLCPICPNCHAMLHSQNPPLSIDDLKARLRKPKR